MLQYTVIPIKEPIPLQDLPEQSLSHLALVVPALLYQLAEDPGTSECMSESEGMIWMRGS